MKSQAGAFLLGEGDNWFNRNRTKMVNPKDDLVLNILKESGIKPMRVLEIGCSNGWRLNEIQKLYGCVCVGVEPSKIAVEDSKKKYPNIHVAQGISHTLRFADADFDLVIFGFCLYLVDRHNLLATVGEGDRVLRDGGHTIILDFFSNDPVSRVYEHEPSLRSYKMNYPEIWLASGLYKEKAVRYWHEHKVTVLKKDIANSFPLEQ